MIDSWQPCSVNFSSRSCARETGCDPKVMILTSKFKNFVSEFHRFFTSCLQCSTTFDDLDAGATSRGAAIRGKADGPVLAALDDTAFLRNRPTTVGLPAPRIERGSLVGVICAAKVSLASWTDDGPNRIRGERKLVSTIPLDLTRSEKRKKICSKQRCPFPYRRHLSPIVCLCSQNGD
jgi:hypothetical protein